MGNGRQRCLPRLQTGSERAAKCVLHRRRPAGPPMDGDHGTGAGLSHESRGRDRPAHEQSRKRLHRQNSRVARRSPHLCSHLRGARLSRPRKRQLAVGLRFQLPQLRHFFACGEGRPRRQSISGHQRRSARQWCGRCGDRQPGQRVDSHRPRTGVPQSRNGTRSLFLCGQGTTEQ